MKYKLTSTYKKLLADTATPVSIYLKLRDVFPNSLLLESSDYHSRENSRSYICCEPVAGMVLQNGKMTNHYPDGTQQEFAPGTFDAVAHIESFLKMFETNDAPLKIASNGLFGYFSHEMVEHFETIKLKTEEDYRSIPTMQYFVYRYIIAVDHFKNELHIFENRLENDPQSSGLERIQYLIQNKNFPEYHFNLNGTETSNLKDEEFIAIVA
ncbi:MAG: anthranilate synthase component I family protein, partial [Sphingobacteriaceae bacterium]